MSFETLSSQKRNIINKNFFVSWEMILVYLFILINILLMAIVPNSYFQRGTIPTIIRSGLDLSIMVLGMTFILIIGEIDVSVASIMIFSTMVTGLLYNSNCPAFIAFLMGVIAGALLGLFNGLLVSLIKMPSVIVTIATSLLFRGIVQIILKSNPLTNFPSFYSTIAWYDIGGVIPLVLIIFIIFAIIFGVVLHKTRFGRELYMVGMNSEAARYSGINVELVKILAFVIMGATAALSGVIFAGRLSGITFSMGKGYELQVIAIVVLGGVSTLGGKGKIYGPIISVFVMAFLTKMLDLFNIHPNVQKIAIGAILIVAVLIPRLNREYFFSLKLKFLQLKAKFQHKEFVLDEVINEKENEEQEINKLIEEAKKEGKAKDEKEK